MTTQEIVVPQDAPFDVFLIPRGMARTLTVEEAAACNALYPKPPWGFTVWDTTTGDAKP